MNGCANTEFTHKLDHRTSATVNQQNQHTSIMIENPHETVQNALMTRINTNFAKLNDGIETVNFKLEAINKQNMNLELFAQMSEAYARSVKFHLEATDMKRPPL